ncbi:MAG TPA: helix-turn-helix domain-containing protein [Edaphobacter sp.]|nr:helix-turn-helix domain-containing protein [Edaphobacter sp.]
MPAKKTSKSPLSRAEEKNTYATPALEKGLDVIELLAHQPGGLTKSEISRELKRTVSEIFRMLCAWSAAAISPRRTTSAMR